MRLVVSGLIFGLVTVFSTATQASNLSVTSFRADKLLYKPDEKGTLSLHVLNRGHHAVSARIEVSLIQELADEKILAPVHVKLERGEKQIEIPFTAEGRFGVQATVRVTADPDSAIAHEYFSVSDNFFEVGIGSLWGAALHTGLGKHRDVAEKARKIRSNWFELFFWAPCDWSTLVSPLEKWWSGQASYPENEKNLLELIHNCHQQGIRVAAYASCNPAGPFAWEVARRRPEMFQRNADGTIDGQFNVENLDSWNDPTWRQKPRQIGWNSIRLDLRRTDTLDFGIDQIIASAKHYGWDAIRFDGHYTVRGYDELSTRNMRRLKERLETEVPDLRLGFNYGRAPEWRDGVTHEMREAMAGGGLYLQEGLRNWRYTDRQYETWSDYATNELRVAKQIQSLGGSYHCILVSQKITPPQAFYKLVYSLVAGGHPFYGEHAKTVGSSDWGAFLTRWSAMLWDLRLRRIKDPEPSISVSGEPRLHWKTLVQERVESTSRKFVVLHLVNPPENDRIETTTFPSPTGPIQVTFRPHSDEIVTRAKLVRPEMDGFETNLELVRDGANVNVSVPEIQYWSMVILELQGTYDLPTVVAKYTEPPDAAKVEAAMNGRTLRSSADPNQRVATEVAENTQIWETNTGYSGHGIKTIASESDADDGLAQSRTLEGKAPRSPFLGRPYMGPIPEGRYRVGVRLKRSVIREDGLGKVFFRVLDHRLDKNVAVAYLQTKSDESSAARKTFTFADSGTYAVYSLEIELKQAAMIEVSLWPEGEQGESTLNLDHIEIETLEVYTDEKLAEWNPVPKPSGLNAPIGHAPRRGLFVRGLHWQHYSTETKDWDARYDIPATYDDIYRYDVIVLANVDARQTTYEIRKIIRDWVNDGGRLVMLGGMSTFGQGAMASTYFQDLLPFQLHGPRDVVQCEAPLILGAMPGVPWPESPLVYWRHNLEVRENCKVLAYAGAIPMLTVHDVGQGKVYAFAGTVLGEPTTGQNPFWTTKAWRDLWQSIHGIPQAQ